MSARTDRLPLEERVLDRLNPILVREIQQSFHGRAFVITLSLALACVTLTAMMAAGAGDQAAGAGRDVFLAALFTLAPILFFIVPFQAFLSTRHEVGGGTAEHLLLTRLKPAAIVRGKLYAAMVQFVLYLSLFAPLAALTFLLRGVDVPTIVVLLTLGFLMCLAATSLAIALGAASAFPTLRALPYGIAALGLGALTFFVLAVMPFAVRMVAGSVRRGDHWDAVGMAAAPTVLVLVLGAMVAASFLAHPYENRSSRFRAFALVFLVVGVAWIAWFVPSRSVRHAAPAFSALAAGLLGFFWLFATTEEEPLTPRVRTMIPRNDLAAALAIPFLPGGGRGVLFTVLLAAVAVAGTHVFLAAAGHPDPADSASRTLWMCWSYAVLFACLGRLVRARLGPGPRPTWIARCVVPAVLGLGCLLPILVDVLAGGGVRRWHYGHLLNPFWTILEASSGREGRPALFYLVLFAAVCALALTMPALHRGVDEVMDLVRRRRRRAS